MTEPPGDDATPAEARLRGHLELLRAEDPGTRVALRENVVSAARWQRALRAPLRVVGLIAAAIGDGVGMLIGARARGDRR